MRTRYDYCPRCAQKQVGMRETGHGAAHENQTLTLLWLVSHDRQTRWFSTLYVDMIVKEYTELEQSVPENSHVSAWGNSLLWQQRRSPWRGHWPPDHWTCYISFSSSWVPSILFPVLRDNLLSIVSHSRVPPAWLPGTVSVLLAPGIYIFASQTVFSDEQWSAHWRRHGLSIQLKGAGVA